MGLRRRLFFRSFFKPRITLIRQGQIGLFLFTLRVTVLRFILLFLIGRKLRLLSHIGVTRLLLITVILLVVIIIVVVFREWRSVITVMFIIVIFMFILGIKIPLFMPTLWCRKDRVTVVVLKFRVPFSR